MREAAAIISADPAGSTGHAVLARAHLGKNEFAKALEAAEAGLQRTPDREWLHRLRTHALIFLKRHKEALEAADECVRLLPNATESHQIRGKALGKLKRLADAEEEYARALQLNPHSAEAHRELGDLVLKKTPKRAEEHYRAALAIEPNDAVALNNLGAALSRQKRRDEAALAYKAAILADPTLKVAKRNAHATVTQQVGKVAGWGTGLFVALQAARLAAAASAPIALAVLAVGVPATLAIRRKLRAKRIAQLKARDPQLVAIFERLEQDKKAGRL